MILERAAGARYNPISLGSRHARLTHVGEQNQALPPERIAEVEDFVNFLAVREHERTVTRQAAAATAPAFAAGWDNPEDSIYDAL
jgi:hypothetical protein